MSQHCPRSLRQEAQASPRAIYIYSKILSETARQMSPENTVTLASSHSCHLVWSTGLAAFVVKEVQPMPVSCRSLRTCFLRMAEWAKLKKKLGDQ